SGLALNGNDYGEIILVNCSDSSIDGGIFTWSTTAIQLYHSDRIDVSGVQIVDQWWGMDLYMSNNVTIYDSTFSGRGFGDALNAWFADGIEIENVNFTNINGIGIDLAEADPFTIRNCLFENLADSGIETYSTQTGLIEDCEFYNTTYGIYFDGTSNTLVTESQFLWNTYGLYSVTESDDNNVTFSSFHDNMYGIRMDDSFSWNIYNNSIAWNDYGIYITTTDDAQVIYNNTFLLNTIYNGYDSGADDWDDHVDGGNYWHDYSGSGVYNIPGGSSVDNYPISYMVYQPIINTPADIWYAEGSTGNYIVWWPFDNSLRDWVVEIDSSEWDSGIWNFNNVNVSIDGLSYGTHTVFVTVWDVDTNFVTDTVIVHVFDDTPPEIDGPANQWLFVDATGQEIDWEVFDLNPADYVLTVDGVEFDTGSWDSGILSLDVDDIDEGEHVLVLTIYDVDGNSASDTVLVRVIDDNVNPTIVDPDDIIYTEGTTGNNIVWDAEDAYPASFEVRYNNTVLYSGSWGGARIIVNVDGLTPGIYEYELRVYDMSNNMATSTVNVTVIPVVPVEPPLIIDWFLVAVIGAVIGGAIVVIVIVYYMRKRTASS
ncbi:MAG: nitrous oxide reductase family maturation protein NosD, partial [Candidatus Thorarchaeota archaeon]